MTPEPVSLNWQFIRTETIITDYPTGKALLLIDRSWRSQPDVDIWSPRELGTWTDGVAVPAGSHIAWIDWNEPEAGQ